MAESGALQADLEKNIFLKFSGSADLSQAQNAIDKLSSTTSKMSKSWGELTYNFKNIAGIVGIGTSLAVSTEKLLSFEKGIISVTNQYAKYGVGITQIKQKTEDLAKSLILTRESTLKLISAFEKEFVFTGLDRAQKILTTIRGITGSNEEAMNAYLGVISKISNEVPALQKHFENLGGTNKTLASSSREYLNSVISAKLAIGNLSLSEAKSLREVAEGYSNITAESEMELNKAKERQAAVEQLKQTFEQLEIAIGRGLIKPMQDFAGFLGRNKDSIDRIGEAIESLGPKLLVVYGIMKAGGALGITGAISKYVKGAAAEAAGKTLGAGAIAEGGTGAAIAGGTVAALPIAAIAAIGLVASNYFYNKFTDRDYYGNKNEHEKLGSSSSRAFGRGGLGLPTRAQYDDANLNDSKDKILNKSKRDSDLYNLSLLQKSQGEFSGSAFSQFEAQKNIFGITGNTSGANISGSLAKNENSKQIGLLKQQLDSQKSRVDIAQKEFDLDNSSIEKQQALVDANKAKVDLQNKLLELSTKNLQTDQDTLNFSKQVLEVQDSLTQSAESLQDALYQSAASYRIIGQEEANLLGKNSIDQLNKQKEAISSYIAQIDNFNSSSAESISKMKEAMIAAHPEQRKEIEGLNGTQLKNKLEAERGQLVAKREQTEASIAKRTLDNTHVQDNQLEINKQEVSLGEQQVNIMDNLAVGIKASAAARMQVVDSLEKGLVLIQKELIEAEKDLNSTNPDKRLAAQKRINELRGQELSTNQQILEQTKQLREGYLSAITAGSVASGRITKIMINQQSNLFAGLKDFGMLTASATGSVQSGSGNRIDQRYTTGGLQGSNHFAYNTPYGNLAAYNAELRRMQSGIGSPGGLTGLVTSGADIRKNGLGIGGTSGQPTGADVPLVTRLKNALGLQSFDGGGNVGYAPPEGKLIVAHNKEQVITNEQIEEDKAYMKYRDWKMSNGGLYPEKEKRKQIQDLDSRYKANYDARAAGIARDKASFNPHLKKNQISDSLPVGEPFFTGNVNHALGQGVYAQQALSIPNEKFDPSISSSSGFNPYAHVHGKQDTIARNVRIHEAALAQNAHDKAISMGVAQGHHRGSRSKKGANSPIVGTDSPKSNSEGVTNNINVVVNMMGTWAATVEAFGKAILPAFDTKNAKGPG